jgi:hypothetical protein
MTGACAVRAEAAAAAESACDSLWVEACDSLWVEAGPV